MGNELTPLLEVKNLAISFFTDHGEIRAVDGLDFSLGSGQTLGIVGESGSGKSVTALSILKLILPPGKIVSGEIFFEGRNLLTLSDSEIGHLRGNRISMIFQDPMTSLNPVFTIGAQIAEAVTIHQKNSHHDAKKRAMEMLEMVKIPEAASRYDAYPHQLSGGMRQRVMIAMALSCKPILLIADEPTTALDVTVQAQILDLLRELQGELNMSTILITHNLGIVAEMCDEVLVMYAGREVERAPANDIFYHPRHPYTVGLLTSLPRLDDRGESRLVPIPGQLPVMKAKASSCTFAPRCKMAQPKCTESEPPLYSSGKNCESRCYFWDQVIVQR